MIEGKDGENTQRIVALITQALSDRLETELMPFSPTFHDLADKLAEILGGLTSGPVKCSISRFAIENVRQTECPAHGSGFRSSKGDLTLFLKAERSFDGLLCDLCFGGSGMELHADDEKVRPASKIEVLLRGLVFDSLHDAMPEIIRMHSSIVIEAQQIDPPMKKQATEVPIKCVMAVMLVNVFSLSAEIEVMLPLSQLEAHLGSGASKPQGLSRSMRDVLAACPFEVRVSLQQQEISLDNILGLEVGSVLTLQSTPAHPAVLQVEGVAIGRGRLEISASQIGVSIL